MGPGIYYFTMGRKLCEMCHGRVGLTFGTCGKVGLTHNKTVVRVSYTAPFVAGVMPGYD